MRQLLACTAFALASCAPHSPTAAPHFAAPLRFTALGTEPFWAARVDGTRLTYTTPDDQAGQTIDVTRSAGRSSVEIRGLLFGRRLILTLTAGPCSDGMSDTVYGYSVVRRLDDDVQRGCARAD